MRQKEDGRWGRCLPGWRCCIRTSSVSRVDPPRAVLMYMPELFAVFTWLTTICALQWRRVAWTRKVVADTACSCSRIGEVYTKVNHHPCPCRHARHHSRTWENLHCRRPFSSRCSTAAEVRPKNRYCRWSGTAGAVAAAATVVVVAAVVHSYFSLSWLVCSDLLCLQSPQPAPAATRAWTVPFPASFSIFISWSPQAVSTISSSFCAV